MKKCCKCKEKKPLTEFHKMKRAKDGLQFKCKSCRRKPKEVRQDIIARINNKAN